MQKNLSFIFSGLFIFLLVHITLGQEAPKNPFDNGKPIGLVYSNIHAGINEGTNPTAFEVNRAYLGYEFQMSKYFSSKIQIDIGSPDDVSQYSLLRRFAYFKDAYLQYTNQKITVRFGIIPLQAFLLQEQVWGHRYIAKTIMDEHGMASSADIGSSVNYAANKFFEFDFTVMNGEGFSSPQTDNSFKAGLGVTVKPSKNLMIRFYGDLIEKETKQFTLANFIAYQIDKKLAAGLEYDFKFNERFVPDHNREAFSAFLSYDLNEKFQVFGRYDKIISNITETDTNPWNLDKDGSSIIAGIQYSPISKIKVALNYEDWFPYANNLENQSFIYLNLEFRVW
jgi:opacity protein-like surface antigen